MIAVPGEPTNAGFVSLGRGETADWPEPCDPEDDFFTGETPVLLREGPGVATSFAFLTRLTTPLGLDSESTGDNPFFDRGQDRTLRPRRIG